MSVNKGYIKNYIPEIAIPLGHVEGVSSVNKFGRATDCDSAEQTDIFDRANATDLQKTWTAPTQARTHTIVSASASDTYAGVGAEIVRVYGLPTWDQAEVSEDITMDGTTGVTTVNSYVIIHRMKVIQSGSSGPNVAAITATAATDATVTAQINAGEGQTQMAVYGVPTGVTAYMVSFYASINRAISAAANVTLLVNDYPTTPGAFVTKHTLGIGTTGTAAIRHEYCPYSKFSGPCIIKMAAETSANNCDVSAGFDLILVED